MIDCHLHSLFSADSNEPPEKMVQAAVEKNMSYIAFTDHVDLFYPDADFEGVTDFSFYFETLQELRQMHPEIFVAIGVELGYHETAEDTYKSYLRNYPFDYVINSVHVVGETDCYYAKHFEGKEKQSAYTEYFEQVLKSLDCNYYYSAVGHLAYVARNAPYADPVVRYADFSDILDEILKKIIEKDKILEINTSTRTAGTPIIPNEDILRRFFELGGRQINFGSDAHNTKRVGYDYKKTAALAQAIGFKGFTITKARKTELLQF